MPNLDPKFKVEIEFPFMELFDPRSPLAQWIANLSRAANDLLLAHRRLDETFAGEPLTGHEAIYDIKQVAAHAWELGEFLRESDVPEIKDFQARLSDKTRGKLDRIFELINAPAPPNKKTFKAKLASARDQASHYSDLDHKLLIGALERLGEEDEDGQPGIGKVRIGETLKDFYAEFASVLDYQLFIPTKGEDLGPLKEFVPDLRELAFTMICFSSETVQSYLNEHLDQLTVADL